MGKKGWTEYYSAVGKDGSAICSLMGGPWGHSAEGDTPVRKAKNREISLMGAVNLGLVNTQPCGGCQREGVGEAGCIEEGQGEM